MLTVSQNSNPIVYNNYVVIKKNFRNVSNQNVNVTKRARFALFARSIGTNSCLLRSIRLPRLIINAPTESNVMTVLDLFVSG